MCQNQTAAAQAPTLQLIPDVCSSWVEISENRDLYLEKFCHGETTDDRLTVNKPYFINKKSNQIQNGGNPVFDKEHSGLALALIHNNIGSLKDEIHSVCSERFGIVWIPQIPFDEPTLQLFSDFCSSWVEISECRDSNFEQIDHCYVTEDRLTVNKAWFYHITIHEKEM